MNTKKTQWIVEHVLYEIFGKGNLSQYDELVEKDVHVHYPSSWPEIYPTDLRGRESSKVIDQEYSKAFQMRNVEIHDLIIGQDKILARWAFNGVHKGNFFAIKASQRSFDLTGQTIYQFNVREKICEVWQAWDLLGLFRQIADVLPIISLSEEVEEMQQLKKRAVGLSEKERECLKYLLLGKTAKETASYMKLSFRTVEYYFENIKDKFGCFSKRELFAYARLLEKYRII